MLWDDDNPTKTDRLSALESRAGKVSMIEYKSVTLTICAIKQRSLLLVHRIRFRISSLSALGSGIAGLWVEECIGSQH